MLFDFLENLFSSNTGAASSMADTGSTVFNPATGLPMLGDNMSGVDVGGSPFGTDIHQSWDCGSGMDWNRWD